MNKWKETGFSSVSPCHSIPISNFVIINCLQTNMQIPPVVEAITEPRASPIRRSGYYSAASDASVEPRDPAIIILITKVSPRSCESPLHRSSPCIWSPTRPDTTWHFHLLQLPDKHGRDRWLQLDLISKPSPAETPHVRKPEAEGQDSLSFHSNWPECHLHSLHCCSESLRRICTDFSQKA